MKLTPMTDFVLYVKEKLNSSELKDFSFMSEYQTIFNYAEFFKISLKLEMLTPMREDGIHIKEPIPNKTSQKRYPYELRDFNVAKSKVIVKKNGDYIPFLEALDIIKHLVTVEDLLKINYDLEITDSAIKKFNLK